MPANIPEPLSVLIRETAVEVATLADVRGMARVDFLMDTIDNEIVISEINTIPGLYRSQHVSAHVAGQRAIVSGSCLTS